MLGKVRKADEPEDSVEAAQVAEAPLTIAAAKRQLAASLGVAETDIKITISS